MGLSASYRARWLLTGEMGTARRSRVPALFDFSQPNWTAFSCRQPRRLGELNDHQPAGLGREFPAIGYPAMRAGTLAALPGEDRFRAIVRAESFPVTRLSFGVLPYPPPFPYSARNGAGRLTINIPDMYARTCILAKPDLRTGTGDKRLYVGLP